MNETSFIHKTNRMNQRKSTRKKAILVIALLICLLFTSCGGASSAGTSAGNAGSESSKSTAAADNSGKKKKKSGFKTEFHNARFHEDKAEGNSEVLVDLSCTGNGYFAVMADSDAKLKIQVFYDSEVYTYDVEQRTDQVYPFTCGDGYYTIKVMKNISGDSYYELYSTGADVKLKNFRNPFVRPNVFTSYSESSKCVKKAAEMASVAADESDFINKVYNYICDNITYDYDEAKTVQAGYIPKPDEVFETGTGICCDYASLAAAMLRSQGIPTKIIYGYVAPKNIYHAWNMFYTDKKGWTTVEFSVNPGDWNRVDLTFSANGSNADFIGDGSNYQDVYQY